LAYSFTKPFNPKELQVRIRNLILSRRQLQKRFAERVIFKPREIATSSQDERFLEKLQDVLEKEYANEHYSVEKMAEDLFMSRSQLHRKLSALTNQSPSQLFRSYRLEKAKQLLEKDAAPIADVAFQVGFGSPAYFSKVFHDEFGYSPRDFRQQQGKNRE
jgi:AraC-like DNA-binding protein